MEHLRANLTVIVGNRMGPHVESQHQESSLLVAVKKASSHPAVQQAHGDQELCTDCST